MPLDALYNKSELKQINYILLPLKSSEKPRFSDEFRGDRS